MIDLRVTWTKTLGFLGTPSDSLDPNPPRVVVDLGDGTSEPAFTLDTVAIQRQLAFTERFEETTLGLPVPGTSFLVPTSGGSRVADLFVDAGFDFTKPLAVVTEDDQARSTTFRPTFAIGPTGTGNVNFILLPPKDHFVRVDENGATGPFVFRTQPSWWAALEGAGSDLGRFNLVWLKTEPGDPAIPLTITTADLTAAKPIPLFDPATTLIQTLRPAGLPSFVAVVGRYPDASLGLKT